MGKSFEERQVTLEEGDNEPWEGGREEEGRIHVSLLPPCRWRVEQLLQGGSPLLFSLRIKAPFTGSVTSCYRILCWQSSPLPRDQ